ncbi:MAG: hypothetical protein H8D72_00050, partial [Planctomycetes bacterium]|nr:hypothetical protein [Planctomycetota bacterium]
MIGFVLQRLGALQLEEVPNPEGVLGLGLVLLFFGALLVRGLLPRVETVLVGGRRPTLEPATWGPTELLILVGTIFVGISVWFTLLQLGTREVSVLDGLLATDLALFSAVLVGVWFAGRSARLAGRPGKSWRALGFGPSAGLARSLLFGVSALVLATPLIL